MEGEENGEDELNEEEGEDELEEPLDGEKGDEDEGNLELNMQRKKSM